MMERQILCFAMQNEMQEILSMEIQVLIEDLIVNIAVLALIAEVISRLQPIQRAILNERRKWQQDLMISLIFGGIIILSTVMGVNIGSYCLNTRVIGAMASGLLGGPLVGFFSSVIGAVYVLFFSVPRVFARSSAFSTLLCGMLGAGFYPYFQRGKWKYKDLFILACFAEIVDMVSLIRITVDIQVAVSAILDAAIPMILLNAIGILIFVACFNTVFIRQDLESSRQLQQMLELTRRCMPLLQEGLDNQEHMEELVSMAIEETDWSCVMIMDRNRILAWKAVNDLDLQSPAQSKESLKAVWEQLDIPEDEWRDSKNMDKLLGHLKSTGKYQEELKELQVLWDVPQIARECMDTGEMVTKEQMPDDSVWYRTMRECSVAAAPFQIDDQSIGCLMVCVKKQWLARQSELDLVQNLVTIGSYQITVRELEKQKLMLQKAEFKALQFQVNPHFLFNALNTVSSVCREDADRARELLITLADYFRYNLDYEAYMVPLWEELEHVKDYLELERARFEDKLIVTYEVPEWMDILIPTLILQPIVENAVRHGISADGRRIVDIQMKETEDGFIVRISDKGKGFSEEVLKKLDSGEAIGNSIGLSNVHKRMKSIYGEKNGLKIFSSDQGSTVELHFFKDIQTLEYGRLRG